MKPSLGTGDGTGQASSALACARHSAPCVLWSRVPWIRKHQHLPEQMHQHGGQAQLEGVCNRRSRALCNILWFIVSMLCKTGGKVEDGGVSTALPSDSGHRFWTPGQDVAWVVVEGGEGGGRGRCGCSPDVHWTGLSQAKWPGRGSRGSSAA